LLRVITRLSNLLKNLGQWKPWIFGGVTVPFDFAQNAVPFDFALNFESKLRYASKIQLRNVTLVRYDFIPKYVSGSGVARVPCALGQEIFLLPPSTKLTEFELKNSCKNAEEAKVEHLQ